jgi:peptidoglycan/LPS O-acetylase OafA/YrhL
MPGLEKPRITIMQSSRQQEHFYRPDIDGLRAIAIISVVAFHARLALFGGGFVGVDVFFVISGYLIGSLVYRDIRNSKFSILHFYERRAKRILPALITVLVVCNVIAFILLSPLELTKYCEEAFSAVFSVSNIYYWRQPTYFDPGSIFKPLLMTWSLGVEEQFYLLFPLGIFLLHRFAKRSLFVWILIITGLSFAVSVLCVNIYPSAAFYLLPMRAWELGLGVLIAVHEIKSEGPVQLKPVVASALGWLGLALIAAPVMAYTENTRFPGFAAVLPTAGAACLILARNSFVNRRLLAFRPMVFIGLVSYSWYLWHWPLLSFARIVSGGLLSVSEAVLIAILSLTLAVVSYHFVEQPFRRSTTPAARLLPRYAVALMLLGAVSFLGYKERGWPSRTPQLSRLETSVHGLARNVCLSHLDSSEPWFAAPCVMDGTGPKVALWGDSHAAALGDTMRELALQRGYGFEFLTKASCRPLSGVTLHRTARPTFARTCETFNRTVLQHLLTEPQIKVVLLAGFWSGPWNEVGGQECYSDTTQPCNRVSDEDSYRNLHTGLLKAITLLRTSGKRVIVATDVPRFDPDPMAVLRNSLIKPRGEVAALVSSRVSSLDAVAEDSLIKSADVLADREVREAASEGGAQILDLSRNLCSDSRCRFWDGGVLLYSDPSHLTAAGAEYALRGQAPILIGN